MGYRDFITGHHGLHAEKWVAVKAFFNHSLLFRSCLMPPALPPPKPVPQLSYHQMLEWLDWNFLFSFLQRMGDKNALIEFKVS